MGNAKNVLQGHTFFLPLYRHSSASLVLNQEKLNVWGVTCSILEVDSGAVPTSQITSIAAETKRLACKCVQQAVCLNLFLPLVEDSHLRIAFQEHVEMATLEYYAMIVKMGTIRATQISNVLNVEAAGKML